MLPGSILGPVLGGVASGFFGAKGAGDAAKAQERMAKKQFKAQRKIYKQLRTATRPYLRAGNNALGAYQYELGIGDRPKGYGGIEMSPATEFALTEGRDTIEGGAAGGGGLYSGATMKALEDYRRGSVLSDRETQLNRLAGLVDTGVNIAGIRSGAGAAYAQGAGTALANQGDALASGAIGRANALTGGINTGIQLWQLGQWANPAATGTPAAPAAGGGLGGWLKW